MIPVRFPPGEPVFTGRPYADSLFAEIDALLAQGKCPDGRLELESEDIRLTCLIHRSMPHLSGMLEREVYSWIPLKYFPMRATQLERAVCNLYTVDPVQILLAAVHFRHRPVLQASTELIDIEHVLNVLAQEGEDAALALERKDCRTLLFLKNGRPTRLYFGNPGEDPREGDLRERFLLHAFNPAAGSARIEVFKKLAIAPDPDAGTSFVKLAQAAKPPPPMTVMIKLGGRVVMQRPFLPPTMTIGRDLSCELLLDNLSVSRRHARLLWERGHFVIEDLESANGTAVNGSVVKQKVLAAGDRIGVGKFELTVHERSEAVHPDATIVMQSAEAGPIAYLVGNDVSVPLGQEITIGKAPGADVQARGFSVGPIHARIRPEGPGAFRLLCSGSHKAKVNKVKLTTCPLRFGDQIQVGRSRFVIVPTLSGEKTAV